MDMEINLLLQIKLNIENRSNKQDYIIGNKFLGDMGNKWKMKIIQYVREPCLASLNQN